MKIAGVYLAGVFFGISLCALFVGNGRAQEKISTEQKGVKMKLTSSAFNEGGMIPRKHTCDSSDLSPQLKISELPAGTKSLAIICDDPDAPVGTWVHWVIFNLPPSLRELPEGIARELHPTINGDSSKAAVQGINDFRRFGYGGPCPPPGSAHRYFFKLYALDTILDFDAASLKTGVTSSILKAKVKGHVLAETALMGKYKRQ